MNDKEFRKWNKEQKLKNRMRFKKNTKLAQKILTRRPGIWNIPDNF